MTSFLYELDNVQPMNDSSDRNANQRAFWSSEFGNAYVDRNKSIDEVNKSYAEQTGITVEEIFRRFFNDLDRQSKILELGCNVGLNLEMLEKMGFNYLHGVELNKKALKIAQERNPKVIFVNSSIEDFESNEKYDLVFTAGVLIHIHPSILESVIRKIVDLSNQYIFGFEYYSEKLEEIKYRNHSNLCWKQDFPLLFRKLFPSLKIVRQEKFSYKDNDLIDIAYLLRK